MIYFILPNFHKTNNYNHMFRRTQIKKETTRLTYITKESTTRLKVQPRLKNHFLVLRKQRLKIKLKSCEFNFNHQNRKLHRIERSSCQTKQNQNETKRMAQTLIVVTLKITHSF